MVGLIGGDAVAVELAWCVVLFLCVMHICVGAVWLP